MTDFDAFWHELSKRRKHRGHGLAVFGRVPSTHVLGRRLVHEYTDEGADLPIFDLVAWEQVEGQGRDGRSWSSPAGGGAWVSLVRPCLRGPLQRLPLLVAVALIEALEPWLGDRCRLKWPNDLVVRCASGSEEQWDKMGGILIAASTRAPDCGHAVISFGLNYTDELGRFGLPSAASLLAQLDSGAKTEEQPSLVDVVERTIDAVDRRLGAGDGATSAGLLAEDLLDSYRAASIHRPGDELRCRIDGSSIEGRFRGFDEHGFLRLDVDGEEKKIGAGEIIEPAIGVDDSDAPGADGAEAGSGGEGD